MPRAENERKRLLERAKAAREVAELLRRKARAIAARQVEERRERDDEGGSSGN